MTETNEENNLENKNPTNNDDKYYNLKEKLLSADINNSNNNKKDDENILISMPKHNEETAFSENIEEEINSPQQNNENLTNTKKSKHQNNNKNDVKKNDIISLYEDDKNDITNITIPEFRNSNIDRETFQKMVEENNKIIDKKIIDQENNTNIPKIKIFLLIVELILGILLAISSIFILFVLYKDDIVDQKLISFIIEPIIFIFSIFGILPYKGKSCKKIIISLYIWEGLFLFPFSFYSISIIKDKNFYNICNRILISRIVFLIVQFLNFILSLILKIDI
jgi:hypothetical protein